MQKQHLEKHPELIALGKEIRRRRRDMGYTQSEFAHEINLGRNYYGGIERGERNPSALNLTRIAKGLNTTVSELFHAVEQTLVR